MTVFLEYAILDNFTMDLLLLFCAALTLRARFKWWRLILGAVVGTVCALATVYLRGIWVYVGKIVCLVLMCTVAVGWGKKTIWHILLTLVYTFVAGGAIVGVFNLLQIDYLSDNGFYYNMPVPLFVYFLAVLLTAMLCYWVVNFVNQNKKIAPHLKRVRVLLDKPYEVAGFCDSGNSVTYDGLPVCFVTKQFGNFSDFFAQCVLQGKTRKVDVATLTGRQTVTAVRAAVEVDGRTVDVFLALPVEKCQTQYELLLSNDFCGGFTE